MPGDLPASTHAGWRRHVRSRSGRFVVEIGWWFRRHADGDRDRAVAHDLLEALEL